MPVYDKGQYVVKVRNILLYSVAFEGTESVKIDKSFKIDFIA